MTDQIIEKNVFNQVGRTNQGIFGLPHSLESAEVVVVPVPWDVTTSGNEGTAQGPAAIVHTSPQLDLYHPKFYDVCQAGIAMAPIDEKIIQLNKTARKSAKTVIKAQELGEDSSPAIETHIAAVNQASQTLNEMLYNDIKHWVAQDKLVIALGGEHSISWPYIHFIAERCDQFGVLQIDAHMDLRAAYCDFDYSHASVMNHVSQLPTVSRLVQVGVRDYCEQEVTISRQHKGKVKTFFERDINDYLFTGKTWEFVCKKIINALPERVYISIDIDGLLPAVCPHTGTPVPGGLSYQQVSYLLEKLALSNKKIIGCDLVEVGNHPWDANVGARLLYQLCGWFWVSAGS